MCCYYIMPLCQDWALLPVTTSSTVFRRTISNWSRPTIQRSAEYNLSPLAQDRPRGGRPRITSPALDRYIRVFHLRNWTAIDAGIPGLRRVSTKTVRNRLRQHGIRPIRPYVGPVLTQVHRRVRWCHTLRNRRRIWFSDDSRFFSKDVMDAPA